MNFVKPASAASAGFKPTTIPMTETASEIRLREDTLEGAFKSDKLHFSHYS